MKLCELKICKLAALLLPLLLLLLLETITYHRDRAVSELIDNVTKEEPYGDSSPVIRGANDFVLKLSLDILHI
jgi:hypothetical protein